MCVDYRDLNKASPKDSFPLTHIDMLIQPDPNGSRRQGENHLHYHMGDIMLQGNALGTQECWSDISKGHVKDTRSTCGRPEKALRKTTKIQAQVKPSKMHLRSQNRKVAGFIVNERGIEVDPDKFKAIWNMPPPRTEIEEAFKKVKQYLETPPILVPTIPGKPLILYLTVLEESMGCVLGQQDASRKKEQAIYYLSKKFIDYEQRYPTLERTCYALVWTVKRLRQYIQKAIKGSALVEQLAHHPLDDSQPLLYEFLDEHIMSIEEAGSASESDGWKLWFDRVSNLLGNEIGAILASQKGQCFPFSARLGFD
ncbi:hypothetical protein CR513_46670, partial [Mucuna pruriens]